MKWLACLVILALLPMGCSSPAHVQISGAPGAAVTGEPSPVQVSGLHAGGRARVTITSTDARGVRWRSTTKLTADREGRLSFDAGRLIGTMHPLGEAAAGAYFWGVGEQQFRVSVGDGSTIVRRRLVRYPVHVTQVRSDGIVANFYSPGLPGRHSAVLVIGGSEGGLPGALYPYALAGQGHPVLALAYFKAPGLPGALSGIRLEYFATALRWLSRQPGVDAAHLVVDGASRGGEAALLIGATFPGLVHGVVAGVPADVAVCSYPGCDGPAWTLHGRPVPYTRQFDDPHPTDDPHAVIDVRRIDGPVLLNCGDRDEVWTSCAYAHAVMTELAHDRYPHQLQECSECDHFVGRGLPDEPFAKLASSGPGAADERAYAGFFAATVQLLRA